MPYVAETAKQYAVCMPSQPDARLDLREVTRGILRAEVVRRAVVYLDEHGFDESTVDEIAAAVGISSRSFFRYFPTKEDVVLGDLVPMGRLIEAELLVRPAGEDPWTALRASLAPLASTADSDTPNVLRSSRVALSTPALRARNLQRHSGWADYLAPIVTDRLEGTSDAAIAAEALVQSALACLYVGTRAWVTGDAERPYAEMLDIAFTAVAPLTA
ncbi:MAG: hypothetical protein JWR01_970 [Subtercola sp.]|nr:hypothetical protein [Subtercola sp.]